MASVVASSSVHDECVPDLEVDAISSPRVRAKRRGRSPAKWYPPGPTTLEEVLSSNTRNLMNLLNNSALFGRRARENLLQLGQLDIVATSCYSGTGCFEGVLHDLMFHLREEVSRLGVVPGRLCSYSATELGQAGQRCLTQHASGIFHVFENVLGRLPNTTRELLLAVQSEALSDYKNMQEEFRLGQIDKQYFQNEKNRMGKAYVDKLKSCLEGVEFNETDFCLVHNQQCFVSPRRCDEHKQSYWIECSGNTCCPWSGMSTQNGWLDTATLPFLTWAYSTRFYEPDSIYQENVPRFPEAELLAIIGDFADGVLKDICARPLAVSEPEPRKYNMRVQTFSPHQLGIPSQRMRQYTSLHLSPWVLPRFDMCFDVMFFRELNCTAIIYLEAIPDAVQAAEVRSRAIHHGNKTAAQFMQNGPLQQEAALSTGDCNRLESWQCWCTAAGKCHLKAPDGTWMQPFALADVTQNAHFSKTVSCDIMPCLLTHTLLWDLVTWKMVPVAAHWLAQGFPHPAATSLSQELLSKFPFEQSLLNAESNDGLSYSAQRTLTGNAMHVSSLGAWLLFNSSGINLSRIVREAAEQ